MIAAVSETDTGKDERQALPRPTPLAGQPGSVAACGYKKSFPGLNHSSLTVASQSTIAPPRIDFTPPLCLKQNGGGGQGLRGELRDL